MAGYSEAQAKAVAAFSLELPQLAQLKQLTQMKHHMKTRRPSIQPSPFASPLRTSFGLMVAGSLTVLALFWALTAQAQTYTVIKHFGILTRVTGSSPRAPLMEGPDGTLYGTAFGGDGYGTVFKVNTDGTGYAVLKTFSYDDGAGPYGDLVLSGRTLYGTTVNGGNLNNGTVFRIDLPPTVLTADPSGSFFTNGFGFNLSGMPGQPEVIEASPDLTSWTPLLTNALPAGHFHFNDPDSTNFVQRFYRARPTPSTSSKISGQP